MKTLIAATLFALTVPVLADTIVLVDQVKLRHVELFSTDFRVNKPLNRAWVEIVFSDYSYGETNFSDMRVQVPGLSYDPELNGVIYNKNGETVVCGTFYNQRWVIDRGMSFRATGRCRFSQKQYSVQVDDGFHIRQENRNQILLTVE